MMETILVLAPFAAAAFAGLLQRYIGDKVAMSLTTGAVGLSAALSLYVFADLHFMGGLARTFELFRFVDIAGFTSTWSVRIDALSSVMLVVVTSVAFLVHVYSWGYMADDPHRARFFAYLSFFTFSMLALVTANDFLQLFFGWEGVGVASYLLIGFWYKKRSANDAAIKAFVTNRVGDFGFALGIMAAFYAYGSIEFDAVFKAAAANPGLMFQFGPVTAPAIEIICGLLFIGAMGKSAQFQAGAIYRLYRGEIRKIFDKITISNSICFAPDGSFAHFSDTALGQVFKVALDAQGWPIGQPQIFLDLTKDGLNPDGAVLDASGVFWVAQWGAGRVAAYAPDGSFLRSVAVGGPHSSCPAFGGADLTTLYCTTALQDMDAAARAQFPDAGKVFALPHIAQGQAEHQVIL